MGLDVLHFHTSWSMDCTFSKTNSFQALVPGLCNNHFNCILQYTTTSCTSKSLGYNLTFFSSHPQTPHTRPSQLRYFNIHKYLMKKTGKTIARKEAKAPQNTRKRRRRRLHILKPTVHFSARSILRSFFLDAVCADYGMCCNIEYLMYEGWNFNFGNAALTFDTAHLQSSYFHRPSMYSPKLCRRRSQR